MSVDVVQPAEETRPEPGVESEFAAHLRIENAKEKAGEPPSPPAPTLPNSATTEDPASVAGEPAPTATAADVEPSTRNPDGTFKKKDPVQERINKAVAKQREAERERDELRAWKAQQEAARPVEAPTPTPPPAAEVSDPAEPTLEQFVNEPDAYTAYMKALAKYEAAKLVRGIEAQRAQQARTAEVLERVNANADAGREKFADWDEAIQDEGASVMLPDYVLQAIHESDQAPELVHYLSRHADEARVIAAKSPHSALLHLGSLTAKLSAPVPAQTKAPQLSRAKPPIKPVGATPQASDPPAVEELAWGPDYIRLNNEKERKLRESRGF